MNICYGILLEIIDWVVMVVMGEGAGRFLEIFWEFLGLFSEEFIPFFPCLNGNLKG